ncbi:MAG TPA: hemolysin family protein [bacterium]|nr:hemolysin family protein [bacterium]
MSVAASLIIILICVIGEAFFSGSEIALVSVDKIKMRHQAQQGQSAAQLITKTIKSPEKILGTTLLGTNVFTATNTTVAASMFYKLLGPPGITVSLITMAFVNWIFCEIVPKSVFQQLSDKITPKIIYPLKFFYYLFFPVVWFFTTVAGFLTTILQGGKADQDNTFVSRNELKSLMKMKHSKSDVKPGEKQMISKMLDFNEIEVGEIFNHLSNVAAISRDSTVEEAIQKFKNTKHRRLPVYKNRIDKIVGIINSFDIMAEDKNKKIKFYVRPAFYVPPSKKIAVLLEELQTNGRNMAIVVDEFGGAEGIITIEDILEEVVGEIEDEYDRQKRRYRITEDGAFILDAHIELDIINSELELDLPEGDYETLAGLVSHHFRRIPQDGESIQVENYQIDVLKANQRAVMKVKIKEIEE